MNKLARMLCIECPASVTAGIVAMLDKRDEENVDFDEFLGSIRTILMFDNFFEEMDSLFHHLDALKVGKIRAQEFFDACTKLSSPDVSSQHDLRIPPAAEVEQIYKKMSTAGQLESPGFLNHSEF